MIDQIDLALRNIELPFIAITLRSTLNRYVSMCEGPIELQKIPITRIIK